MSKGKLPESMQSRSTPLKPCNSREDPENVEIIDLDNADVVIIDRDKPGTSRQIPAKLPKKERGNSPNYIISIDDDSEEETNDETGSSIPRSRYGLDLTSESESFTSAESSDSDSSDCEIIDDASGSIREDWERANSKKRNLNKLFGDAFDDNFGATINSFYSSGPSSSKSVPKNNVVGTESIHKEFERFSPSVFFEEEFNNNNGDDDYDDNNNNNDKDKVDSVSGKGSKFAMKCCSDKKGKGVACEENKCGESESESVKEAYFEVVVEMKDESRNGEENEMNNNNNNNNCLVVDREKHKESDEFRRAAEAEWAARQEQMRIQAEEAQKLKKRRKAESMRLLDMERRTKLRLDEIRQTQKKNEETMSIKDEVRSKVIRDLKMIEAKYHADMPSILRALGIPVSGPSQIRSAYRQALVRFHPDRVQTTDIHQLVKAEETFKFISKFKEKLLGAAV